MMDASETGQIKSTGFCGQAVRHGAIAGLTDLYPPMECRCNALRVAREAFE
jgi:hypothetical protein